MDQCDFSAYPLCAYLLWGYFKRRPDRAALAIAQPAILDRYERLFRSALDILDISKQDLKRKSEFNFDSGDVANVEAGIAMLRVVVALHQKGFQNLSLITSEKNCPVADLTCEKNGHAVCVEVKAITKQSKGRRGLSLDAQLHAKLSESVSRAAVQLQATAKRLGCDVKMLACVSNWLDQSVYLDEADYQCIVDDLERHGSLSGIDAILFITHFGQEHLFLNETGKCIDAE